MSNSVVVSYVRSLPRAGDRRSKNLLDGFQWGQDRITQQPPKTQNRYIVNRTLETMGAADSAAGHLCTIILIIAFAAVALTYFDAYGEENCLESQRIVSFEAPERVGSPTATGTACIWYADGLELRKPVIIRLDS